MVVKLSSKGQLVIPQPIREAMGLRPGMTFQVTQQESVIVLEPVDFVSPINALYGKYAEMDLVASLELEHREELAKEITLERSEQ
jgi:AbrB family looped-hinge helix DNA binding protein